MRLRLNVVVAYPNDDRCLLVFLASRRTCRVVAVIVHFVTVIVRVPDEASVHLVYHSRTKTCEAELDVGEPILHGSLLSFHMNRESCFDRCSFNKFLVSIQMVGRWALYGSRFKLYGSNFLPYPLLSCDKLLFPPAMLHCRWLDIRSITDLESEDELLFAIMDAMPW